MKGSDKNESMRITCCRVHAILIITKTVKFKPVNLLVIVYEMVLMAKNKVNSRIIKLKIVIMRMKMRMRLRIDRMGIIKLRNFLLWLS